METTEIAHCDRRTLPGRRACEQVGGPQAYYQAGPPLACDSAGPRRCGERGRAIRYSRSCAAKPSPMGVIDQGYGCDEFGLRNQTLSYPQFEAYCLATGLLAPMLEICAAHWVVLRDVYSPRRKSSEVRARAAIWEMLLTKFSKNHAEIAALFGRDDSTVRQAIKRLARRRLAGESLKPVRPVTKWSLK